jgi:transcriptional regulator with XRE-family HTH domain
MDFTNRLLAVMQHYGHNKNSFSVAIGASNNSVIGRLVNESGRRPSFDLIEMILKKFPAINPTWLLIGEGEMFINRPDFIPRPKERLIRMCEALMINAFKLAEAAGVSKQEAVDLRNGITEPSNEVLQRLAKTYPIINENWLLYNEGSMFIESVDASKFIPIFEDIPAGSTVEDLKHLQPTFINYSTKFNSSETRKAFGFHNQSNDFAPILNAGDYIIATVETIDDIIPSDLVFISTKKRNYLRRLAIQPTKTSKTITLTDNSGLTYEIIVADITLIGMVRSVFKYIQ